MKRSDTHVFDAPIERVWAMMCDIDAHVAKAERAGHRDIEVLDHTVADDHAHVELKRTVTVELPGFAKRVMEPTQRVRTIDDWYRREDGTCDGTFGTDVRGAPFSLKGTTSLEADGADRTRYRVDIEVQIKVPVVGKRLEKWAVGDVDEQIANEFAAGDEWLAANA